MDKFWQSLEENPTEDKKFVFIDYLIDQKQFNLAETIRWCIKCNKWPQDRLKTEFFNPVSRWQWVREGDDTRATLPNKIFKQIAHTQRDSVPVVLCYPTLEEAITELGIALKVRWEI